MITAKNITKYYKIHGKRHLIFENLSLQLSPGDRLGLMGPNGAGKSTLLRLLCGVEHPNQGEIIRSSTISWPVGLANGFIATLTGRENIKFICRLFSCHSNAQRQKIDFVDDFAELGGYFDMPVNTYSSGMTSRLAFGMSMAFDFDFYVVDEGFSVGDSSFRKKSLDVFKAKTNNRGMIIVSHDIATIKEYCNQGVYLNNGQLTHSYDIDEIVALYQGEGASGAITPPIESTVPFCSAHGAIEVVY